MRITVGEHNLSIGDNIKIAQESLKFRCALDNNSIHSYPRPDTKQHTAGTGTSYTVSNAAYTASNGNLVLTLNSNHGLTTNDKIRIKPESLIFECTMDGRATKHGYPRITDPKYGLEIDAVSYTHLTLPTKA